MDVCLLNIVKVSVTYLGPRPLLDHIHLDHTPQVARFLSLFFDTGAASVQV